MKRLLAAAALAAALHQAHAERPVRRRGATRVRRRRQGARRGETGRCTKLTQSGLCVGAPVLLPADAVKAPAEEKVVRLADPKEDGWHTLQHDNGQKKTVMKMTGREVTE